MGQAHSRSYLRIPTLFPERDFEPRLVVLRRQRRRRGATRRRRSFGFAEATDDWRRVVEHPDVDVVVVTAPNMLHEQLCVAAAEAGKHLFCEKPVGGTPEQTVRVAAAARRAGVITGVGYNYRWVPLVLHARELIAAGRLGEITNYRGRFFSMYGSDPLGLLSWRFLAGRGRLRRVERHPQPRVDLAHLLVGPITKVVGTSETFIRQRPLPEAAAAPTTPAARRATRPAR